MVWRLVDTTVFLLVFWTWVTTGTTEVLTEVWTLVFLVVKTTPLKVPVEEEEEELPLIWATAAPARASTAVVEKSIFGILCLLSSKAVGML